jgi:hypothetical protein
MNSLRAVTYAVFAVVCSAACSAQQPLAVLDSSTSTSTKNTNTSENSGDSQSSTGESLQLTWDKSQNSVETYKIFLSKEKKSNSGGTLVQTLSRSGEKEIDTAAELPLSTLGADFASGTDVCFYIVAEIAGAASEPSDVACVQL